MLLAAFFLGLLFSTGTRAVAAENQDLSGTYYFRYVAALVNSRGDVESNTLWGEILFDGQGGYRVNGWQIRGSGARTAYSSQGRYSVQSNASVILDGLFVSDMSMLGALGADLLVGGSTLSYFETIRKNQGAAPARFLHDIFAAVKLTASASQELPAPAPVYVASMEIPVYDPATRGSAIFASEAFGDLAAGGTLSALEVRVRPLGSAGAATHSISPGPLSRSGYVIAYRALPADGVARPGLSGNYEFAMGVNRNVILGGPVDAGRHGITLLLPLEASRAGGPNLSAWDGLYRGSYLSVIRGNQADAVASWTVASKIAGETRFRTHTESFTVLGANANPGPDFYGQTFHLVDSIQRLDSQRTQNNRDVRAKDGSLWIRNATLSASAPEIGLGLYVRPLTTPATGPYIDPEGVTSAGTYHLDPILATGTYVALFGSRLSTATEVASGSSLPTRLAGVQVLVNDEPAPIYYVSPGNIMFLLPRLNEKATVDRFGRRFARIQVVHSSGSSNVVQARVGGSSPAPFTIPPGGNGEAAAVHADGKLIQRSDPLVPGETVVVFYTGCGLEAPDAAGPAPADRLIQSPRTPYVYLTAGDRVMADLSDSVVFDGLAPGWISLCQMNLRIPSSLTLSLPIGSPLPVTWNLEIGSDNSLYEGVPSRFYYTGNGAAGIQVGLRRGQ